MGLVSYGERAVSQASLVKGHYLGKLSSMVLSVQSAHFSWQPLMPPLINYDWLGRP